jgi:hypothetical protein
MRVVNRQMATRLNVEALSPAARKVIKSGRYIRVVDKASFRSRRRYTIPFSSGPVVVYMDTYSTIK